MDNVKTAQDCPCTGNCARHGNCVECVAHHRKLGSLTVCMREVAKAAQQKKEEGK